MRSLTKKISAIIMLTAFLVQTGAVFWWPKMAMSQEGSTIATTTEVSPASGTTSPVNTLVDQEFRVKIEQPLPETTISGVSILRASVNIPADRVYFFLTGPETKTYLAMADNNSHYYSFNSWDLKNGSYFLEARAYRDNLIKSAQTRLNINNIASPANIISTTTIRETASSSQEIISNQETEKTIDQLVGVELASTSNEKELPVAPSIKFINTPEFISGPVTIRAQSSFKPDSAKFIVAGQTTKEYPARISSDNIMSFLWTVEEGILKQEYQLSVIATQDGKSFSDTIEINYEREDFTSQQTAVAAQAFELVFMNTPKEIVGTAKIYVSTNKPVEKVEFEVVGETRRKFSGQSKLENTFYFEWPTNEFPDGLYEVNAGAIIAGTVAKKISTAVQVKNQVLLERTDEPISVGTKIDTVGQTAEKVPEVARECQAKNIFNAESCAKFLALPMICRLSGVLDDQACREYLAMPTICREKGLSKADCDLFQSLPKECQAASLVNREECNLLVIRNSLPTVCRDQGISEQKACQQYLLELNLPQACREKNISNAVDCLSYMKKPQATNAAAIETLPQACRDSKIEDTAKCAAFMKLRNQEQECEALDIDDKKECNQFLLEKYSPDACLRVGVVDRAECSAFLFNRFQDLISCDEGDEWTCRNDFKENYLGRVIERQNDFSIIKELSTGNDGIKISVIKSRLKDANIVPVNNGEAVFKLQNAKQAIIINRDQEIIQTAPVILVSDQDQDGLPDMTELRIGTDPEKRDTDGDSYDDMSEISNGYNPAGEGRLESGLLAAIDRAIINNEMIEHPKAVGPASAGYEVGSVENMDSGSESGNAYMIKGKADPNQTVSLFIYSDLPVVTTVSTDEFGNWQYEFENILVEGDHEVYVALNDETGKVLKKSNPLNFFVREAKAVSVHDYVAAAVIDNPTEPEGMINYYLVFALVLIGFSLFLFIFYLGYYRKRASI